MKNHFYNNIFIYFNLIGLYDNKRYYFKDLIYIVFIK
jgi:hypothetical protein